MAQPPDSWLVDACRKRVDEFSAQLRGGVTGAGPVPNLEWTVAELAQHVASLPALWLDQHGQGADFVRPDDFAVFIESTRGDVTETDPALLADLIDSIFAAYLEEIQARPDRWLYGSKSTATEMCGFVLNESVLHGRDLAAVTGVAPPSFTQQEANAVVAATMSTVSFFIDPDKARAQPDGVYHMKFRGGDDYTLTKQGPGVAVSTGKPPKADAHLNADPATFVMVSLGRKNQYVAALTGGSIAYGRKPWRLLGLAEMVVDGV